MKKARKMYAFLFPTLALLIFMFDPITIAIIIKALAAWGATAAVVGTVITIAYLTLNEILNWFHSHRHLAASDRDIVGVTIKEAIQNGKYTIVQGVFNKRTSKMVESRRINADRIDDALASKHAYQKRVIYDLS